MRRVSRGPELSRDHQSADAPVNSSTTPSGGGVETPSAACSVSDDSQLTSGTSTIRRKGSLVPALPITTQTTRLISQQSRSASDDVIVETPHHQLQQQQQQQLQQQQSVHSQQLPTPPTGANTTTTLDSRMLPTHGLGETVENGSPQSATRATQRLPAAAVTLPRDLPSPPTSANTTTTTLDSRNVTRATQRLPAGAATLPRDLPSATATTADTRIPLPPSNLSADIGANWTSNRSSPAGHRPTVNGHGTPTRTASARAVDTSGHGSVASTRAVDANGHGSPARAKPAPPKRSETTKLTADPRQTKAFIMNLDRVISLKNCQGSAGLATLPVPLPPRPKYVDVPTYLDTDDLPPPPAELLEGLRSMRRQGVPLPPIPAPGRR